LVREELYAFSVIPARYEYVPIWRTYCKYRKEMKCGYSKLCTITETRMKPYFQ